MSIRRRTFLQQAALAGAVAQNPAAPAQPRTAATAPEIQFPRVFTGRHLTAIAFPLGGVCAGSISLGGRGNSAIGRFSTAPTKGMPRATPFPRFGPGRPRNARRACTGSAYSAAVRRLERTRHPECAGPGPAGLGDVHWRIPSGAHRFRGPRTAGTMFRREEARLGKNGRRGLSECSFV